MVQGWCIRYWGLMEAQLAAHSTHASGVRLVCMRERMSEATARVREAFGSQLRRAGERRLLQV